MSNKKGFTLIELLAVIIILAIIALIATPIILNVVEESKLSAGISESNIIVEGINNYCEQEKVKESIDSNYVKKCKKGMTVEEAKELVNLGKSDIKEIIYNGSKITYIVIESNNHIFTMCSNGKLINEEETCPKEELVGISFNKVMETFPELKLADTVEKGCAVPSEKNYSYMGGCYLKGKPTNNSIWYSGFLWRIMGINKDGTIRMITDENVTAVPWGPKGSVQDWNGSYVKDWLNTYFYSKLKGNDIIVEQQFCSDTVTDTTQLKQCSEDRKFSSKVGLMTIDEYILAGERNSYLNIMQDQWTMTPFNDSSSWHIFCDGSTSTFVLVTFSEGIRSVINVNKNAKITGGNGVLGKIWNQDMGPYVLNEDKNIEVNGKLVDKITAGEYVELVGHKYRVVDKTNNGVKLLLDGYYEEPYGTKFTMKYGTNNIFTLESGIGQKLNNDVFNFLRLKEVENKIVSDTNWYQPNFNFGQSYELSLEENEDTLIKSTIGLIRVGEMLSGQSSSIMTNGYTAENSINNLSNYWLMNKRDSNSWRVVNSGLAGSSPVDGMNSLRPVIVVKSDNIITGGNGTWYNPYKI